MEKTDYKITEFHNSEFGSIRMIEDGGRLLFSGIDVAFALGYAKPRNAINVHCKGALKRGVLTAGGVQPMIFIPEGDVYRLITKSRLKSAQNFEKWVFDEVLPAIRKTGGYMESNLLEQVKDNPELLLEFAERLLAENNRNRELQSRVNDMQPKADYFDHFTITLNLYYKPTVLKVRKTVTGYNMEPNRSYEFTIKAVPPSGTDASTATITDGQIFIRKGTDDKVQNLTFTNNKATFNLAKDEFVDISCLPTGWTYTVTETDPGKNYKTSYKLNDSDATDGRAAEFKTSTTGNDEVTFTNASTVAPPETGRTIHDSEWILLLIVILVISAGGMTFLRKMKKRY